MRKTIILLGMIGFTNAYAQQDTSGKVGINTETPTETLDVKGTLRVQELPKSGEGKIYNGEAVKNTTFTGTRTLVTDANGVVGFVDGLPGNTGGSTGETIKYTAGQGISISDANVISRTGLEEVTQEGKQGWRLVGVDSSLYGNIGEKAVDMSYQGDDEIGGAIGNYSVALGYITKASGEASFAMGRYPQATGYGSVAMGLHTKASGGAALAIGSSLEASGPHSVAMGHESVSSGTYSFALGYYTKSSGHGSFAMGANTTASANFALAMGRYSQALGLASFAMGDAGTIAEGDYSFAVGHAAKASGAGSIAMGYNPSSSGAYSVSMGYENNATGDFSTAFGLASSTSGEGAFASGYAVSASGEYSSAFGGGTIASGKYSMAIGRGNYDDAGNLFAVGNGNIDPEIRSNIMVVRDNAVGINLGQEIPKETLEVKGTIKMQVDELGDCDASRVGTIAFSNDNFYGCKSTGWVQLNN